MARKPQRIMYNILTCEFHQANNLNKFYTDERTIKLQRTNH